MTWTVLAAGCALTGTYDFASYEAMPGDTLVPVEVPPGGEGGGAGSAEMAMGGAAGSVEPQPTGRGGAGADSGGTTSAGGAPPEPGGPRGKDARDDDLDD
jgi:hypothetical protein